MKLTNFVIINLITFSAFAQNWALFPPDQGGYYTNPAKYRSYENYETIQYWSVDSIKNGMNEDVWYFNSKFLPETYQKCFAGTGDYYRELNPFDSLLYRNDTIFYKIKIESDPFYFLPNALEGESWIVYSERKKDSIKITYEKKEFAEFLNLSDSVKQYSFELIGIHADSTNIDEQSMRLSKHYGLIEYIDFNRLFNPYYSIQQYETIRLASIENDTLQTGYQLPSFKTFLPYSEGDVLVWQEDRGHFLESRIFDKYHLDSLIKVVENEDSLYYIYNRTSFNYQNEISGQQSDLVQSFVFADFENIVGAKPNLWGVGKGTIPYYSEEYSAQKLHLWNSVNHLISEDEDTVIIAWSDYSDNIMDTTLCQTESTGVFYSCILENQRGLVSRSQNYFYNSFWEFNLIGSKINGVEVGTLDVIVGIEEQKVNETIQLYPNPANNYINLMANETLPNASYSIVDIDGRIRNEGTMAQQTINITHLSPGIYFLNVISGQKAFTVKFVKQPF